MEKGKDEKSLEKEIFNENFVRACKDSEINVDMKIDIIK
jgi:hypothetical protein